VARGTSHVGNGEGTIYSRQEAPDRNAGARAFNGASTIQVNEAAFTRFFHDVYPSLQAYCVRLTGDGDLASDLAQEAFVRMATHQVDGEEPALRVWLYKVATHLVRDRYRVESNRARLLAENPVFDQRVESPDHDMERRERAELVQSVLDGIPPRDREMLLMRHGGFSYKEIAEALDVAPASVGTLLARAQRRFANGLEGTVLADGGTVLGDDGDD
jgi:RNA polymerase sigma-70 factor (ECF subfamily)